MELSPVKIRFGRLAYAVEAPKKVIRNYLQRGQVKPASAEKPDGGWAEYTFTDVAIFALVRAFVTFGLDVRQANALAHETLEFFPDVRDFEESAGNTSGGFLHMPWVNRRLLVFRDDEAQWKLHILDVWKETAAEPANVYLVVNVESLLRRAFDRASEGRASADLEEDDQ